MNNQSPQLEAHLRALATTERQAITLHPRLGIPVLQLPKRLQQPHYNITRLRQRILLPDTDLGTSVERKEPPAGSERSAGSIGRPALGLEVEGVGAVDVGPAVHAVDAVHEDGVFGDEGGGSAVGATAVGEHGVDEGDAGVGWDGLEESEAWRCR